MDTDVLRVLSVFSAAAACKQEFESPPAAATRIPLANITNVRPLDFSSPLKRSSSALLPSASAVRPPQPPIRAASERSPLSPLQRAAVITLAVDGQPKPVIAKKLQTTVATVSRVIDHYDENKNIEDRERTGRPPLLAEEDKERIALHALVEPLSSTPKQIRRSLGLDSVSPRTIRRVLDSAGIFGRIARITPPLKDVHLQKRLSFAEGYGKWKEEDWSKVMWTDEASVLMGTYGQVWVQRAVSTEWDPEHTVHRGKHPPKLHIWACFSAAGVGGFHIFEENLDAVLMKEILQKHVLKSAAKLFPRGQWWFQQDNDPKHKSKLVQAWIKLKGIDCLEWPPYSPDLNPIENLWAHVKRRVEARNTKTLDELRRALEAEWHATEASFCRKLVHSMADRCRLVRENSGWFTPY